MARIVAAAAARRAARGHGGPRYRRPFPARHPVRGAAGLDRSGLLADGQNGYHFQTVERALRREGDPMQIIDVLVQDAGVRGSVTFCANCRAPRPPASPPPADGRSPAL